MAHGRVFFSLYFQLSVAGTGPEKPHPSVLGPYLIFVIFSPRAQFLARFFSTQKRVNHTKTDFATKQRKSQETLILPKNIVKCDKTP